MVIASGMKYAYPRHTVNLGVSILKAAFVIWSGHRFSDAGLVADFERAFAGYAGTTDAVAVDSGRLAFYLILNACRDVYGYPEGSEIILAAYNFPLIVPLVAACRLCPVFADIDPRTFTIDPQNIEEKITPRTKAIVVTHVFGNPCNMDAVCVLARKHRLQVIEDAAHVSTATWRGRRCGSLGDCAFFSLSTGKTIACFGGGVITTCNGRISTAVRRQIKTFSRPSARRLVTRIAGDTAACLFTQRMGFTMLVYPVFRGSVWSWNKIEAHTMERVVCAVPLKHLFSGMQASLGLAQLSRAEEYVKRKQKIIDYFDAELENTESISVQRSYPEAHNSKFYFMLRVKNKNRKEMIAIRRKLLYRGVDTQFPDMCDCSTHPAFREYAATCLRTADIAPQIFEIPSDISLQVSDLKYIVHAVKACCV